MFDPRASLRNRHLPLHDPTAPSSPVTRYQRSSVTSPKCSKRISASGGRRGQRVNGSRWIPMGEYRRINILFCMFSWWMQVLQLRHKYVRVNLLITLVNTSILLWINFLKYKEQLTQLSHTKSKSTHFISFVKTCQN